MVGVSQTMTTSQTPIMKQYSSLKKEVPDALLFFRLGDFYELLGNDAIVASQLLQITLTSRDKKKADPIPMAGVPHHSASGYIQKLLKAGKKVAIAEQMEPEVGKNKEKIVERKIVRILTPAIQFESEGFELHYLATAVPTKKSLWILACLDASTGQTFLSDPLDLTSIAQECQQLPIQHFLNAFPQELTSETILKQNTLNEVLPSNYLSQQQAQEILKKQYAIEALDPFFPSQASVLALGILICYLLRTQQQERLGHLQLPDPLHSQQSMILGPHTQENLELATLFDFINKTHCALGARQLQAWLDAPLIDSCAIQDRQQAILELQDEEVDFLRSIYDLKRICARITTGQARPQDTLALGKSLIHLKPLKKLLQKKNTPLLREYYEEAKHLDQDLQALTDQILTQQQEPAPVTTKEGGIFRKGFHPSLDRLIDCTQEAQIFLKNLENRERKETGIASLKVRYNRVFGYYIEITQTHLKSIPAHYQRKQTMVGAERFFTEELKQFEETILTASHKQKTLEEELFSDLVDAIECQIPKIMQAAHLFGVLDALLSLAQLAHLPGWHFPTIDDSLALNLENARHPIVEQSRRGNFVPHTLHLTPETRLALLITGPNMGGKSTLMREVALIVILGQMGSAVCAQKAHWGVVSSIYTRIGAHDSISQGQSTFMVEMTELAHILKYANARSLLILDEVGRGTSTYDGMSVAWASLEWICTKIRARTFFSTHYHELVSLTKKLPGLANVHLAVDTSREPLRFLYELQEGAMLESFGIQVAQLAGLPPRVIQRAYEVLEECESHPKQLSLFSLPAKPISNKIHPVLETIQKLNIEETTPLKALQWIEHFQQILKQD